jgi:CheY-like chemotaxis protein
MRTVLVVDDDQAIRDSLSLLLEGRWNVVVACDGAEALEAVDREDVDAMVLDVHMRGIDGVGVLRGLASRGLRVPLVLVSADADLPGIAPDAPWVDWMAKPFDPRELERRLDHLVSTALVEA